MKKQLLILALVAFFGVGTAQAQLLQLGLKLQYSTHSIDDMINDVTTEANDFSTDFLRGCEGGLLVRANIGRWITIQPEANFSIGSVWDSVDAQDNFIDKIIAAYSNVQTVNLSIPVLVGVHLLDFNKMLGLRVFAGPEFYTTIKGATDKAFDFGNYSLIGGVGVDLLGFIYVDGRVTRSHDGDMFYRLGVGLLF